MGLDLHPGLTYAVIMSEKINRAIVALVGAGIMIIVGVLDQEEAIKGVDWNTIGLLTGMMILVSISRRSGMFEYHGDLVGAGRQGASGRHPVPAADHHGGALRLSRQRHHGAADGAGDAGDLPRSSKVPPYPYLFAEIFASNIGGTATLIGDPPNILIGSQVGLDLQRFRLST